MYKLKKCINCEKYTLKEICPYCKSKTKRPRPPKFSLEDKYGKYRRKIKYKDAK